MRQKYRSETRLAAWMDRASFDSNPRPLPSQTFGRWHGAKYTNSTPGADLAGRIG
jgi:hypothetical protein